MGDFIIVDWFCLRTGVLSYPHVAVVILRVGCLFVRAGGRESVCVCVDACCCVLLGGFICVCGCHLVIGLYLA